jgi:hypothetical protein
MNQSNLTPEQINQRISLADAHLAEIINSNTFRQLIDAAKDKNTLEAYWDLASQLSREFFTHLEIYKGNSGATAYSCRLDEILNGIDIDEVDEITPNKEPE